MRDWHAWRRPLTRALRAIESISYSETEQDRFFEVEYGLRLHERLQPDTSCLDVWTHFTGYWMQGIHDDPAVRRMCSIARQRLRYLRTASSWKRWLTWYAEQPARLRLYDVNLQTGECHRHPVPGLLPERLDLYDLALDTLPEHRPRTDRWTPPGRYAFQVLGETYHITLPEALSQLSQAHPPASADPPPQREREPIVIPLAALEHVAERLQRRDPSGNWCKRFHKLRFQLVRQDGLVGETDSFVIDRLFHLVGMVGSGKSTLIVLVTCYLVMDLHLQVALVLNTIAESIHLASKLRLLGIAATPALGTERGTHRLKYGQANARELMPQDVFQLGGEERPALAWTTAPCAISGLLAERGPIPSGYEPCYALLDEEGKRYPCPLRSLCPVHQAAQDLPQSQVWIVNPASLLFSRASEHLGQVDLRLLEAVYSRCDVLIVDEADRVQVQWDRTYAPIDNLVGDPEALLDWLDETVAGHFRQQRRRQLRHARHRDLKLLVGEAVRFSSDLLHLLFNYPDLVEWSGRRPLTNSVIYAELARELACAEPGAEPDEAVRARLYDAFMQFSHHPTSLEEGGDLAAWINDIRIASNGLQDYLLAWLQERVPWDLASHPQRRMLLRRLELSLLLTAMDKRVDEVLRNWLWAAPEFGERRVLDQSPPEEYVDLVPESPLGNLLGYQYIERPPSGVLKYIQCYGLGRWLLLHFFHLFSDLEGDEGPHVFLTSATSWAPGSPQFHLLAPPQAILSAPPEEREAIASSTFDFLPVPGRDGSLIRVSGTWGKDREDNLEALVCALTGGDSGASRVEQELQYWRNRGMPRRVLLVVGSYAEATLATRIAREAPNLRHRVLCVHPDDDDSLDSWLIRRGEVEQLVEHDVDVLVAPLLAIQRGFNILDEQGAALLGSAFFLVRPYPVPDDLSQHVIGINAWVTDLLATFQNRLPDSFGLQAQERMGELRRRTYAEWMRRLDGGSFGLEGLKEDLYGQLLWDQFVVVWQTIGRLVRGGRAAHVFFVDAAFHPRKGRSMLRGWRDMLEAYLKQPSSKPFTEQLLAEALYEPAYRALNELLIRLEKQGRW